MARPVPPVPALLPALPRAPLEIRSLYLGIRLPGAWLYHILFRNLGRVIEILPASVSWPVKAGKSRVPPRFSVKDT